MPIKAAASSSTAEGNSKCAATLEDGLTASYKTNTVYHTKQQLCAKILTK